MVNVFILFGALGFALAQPATTAGGDKATGIEGAISVSPVKGGPIRANQDDSRPLAKMAFEVKQDGKYVNEFQTDEHGYFRILLPPGQYTVTRKATQAIGWYGPFDVVVDAGTMTNVRWKCDSGLR